MSRRAPRRRPQQPLEPAALALPRERVPRDRRAIDDTARRDLRTQRASTASRRPGVIGIELRVPRPFVSITTRRSQPARALRAPRLPRTHPAVKPTSGTTDSAATGRRPVSPSRIPPPAEAGLGRVGLEHLAAYQRAAVPPPPAPPPQPQRRLGLAGRRLRLRLRLRLRGGRRSASAAGSSVSAARLRRLRRTAEAASAAGADALPQRAPTRRPRLSVRASRRWTPPSQPQAPVPPPAVRAQTLVDSERLAPSGP